MTDELGPVTPASNAGQEPGGADKSAPAHTCIVPPSPIPGHYGHRVLNKCLAESGFK
jgi:hypothetical protein